MTPEGSEENKMTVEDVLEKNGVPETAENIDAIKDAVQQALNEGMTEFRVDTLTGSVSDDEKPVKLEVGEKEVATWSGFQGMDDNSEWHTLIAKKPEEDKGSYEI